MTYRRFTALARRVRAESTPDVCDKWLRAEKTYVVQVGQTYRVRRGVAAVAVAACVAVLAGVALTEFRPLSPLPSGSDVSGSTSSSDGLFLVLQPPAWYAPGAVTVEELVCDLEDDNGGRISKAGVLDVSARASLVPGHETCDGIYYYTDTDEVVCCWHAAVAALQTEGLWEQGGEIYVVDYQPSRRIILFLHEKDQERNAYLYDWQNQNLKKISGPLYTAGSTIGRSLWTASERTYSLLLNTDANGEETLLLVDLLSGGMTVVAPWAHKSAEDGYFSPTGKYVVYTKGGSDIASVQRHTVVHTIESGKQTEIQGQVRHILPDDSGMVVETPDGLVLFCGDTGNITPYADIDLPVWYRYQVREGKQYANDCRPLLVVDLLTGETVDTLPQEVHAWQVDRQGRYLYYYVRESDGIVCRDIATGQEFSIPVSREFIEMQRRFTDKEIQFYLLAEEQTKTLHLSYIRYDRPREDSQAIQNQLKGNVQYRYTELVADGVTGLVDFAELIEDFADTVTLGRGDRFVYLDCTAWIGHTAYWVEDHRTNSFYFVSYNDAGNIVYINSDTKAGVSTLTKDAKVYTEVLLKSGKISVVEAVFDYGHFVKNGKVDETALAAYNRRTEALMAAMDHYFVYTKEELSGDSGARYEQQSDQDLQELREFLDFVNTLTFAHTEDYWDYQDGYQVKIELGAETVWFGRYGGKPVVVIGTHYAHCTEAEYDRWMTWAMNKAEECLTPPEETEQKTPSTTSSNKTTVTRTSSSGRY